MHVEERNPDEVTGFAGVWAAPAGTPALNLAFGGTPADLVTAIVAERRNLLGTRVTGAGVGALTPMLCTDASAATTGTQVSVDGGNDRVI